MKTKKINVYLASRHSHGMRTVDKNEYFHQIKKLILECPDYGPCDTVHIESVTRYINGNKYVFFYDAEFLVSGRFSSRDLIAFSEEGVFNTGFPEEVILGCLVIGKLSKGGGIVSLTQSDLEDIEWFFQGCDNTVVYSVGNGRPTARGAHAVSPARGRSCPPYHGVPGPNGGDRHGKQ